MGLMVGERGHTTWVKRWTAVGIACCDVHPSIVICVLLSMRVRVGRSWNGWKITSATAMYVVNMPLTARFDLCDFHSDFLNRLRTIASLRASPVAPRDRIAARNRKPDRTSTAGTPIAMGGTASRIDRGPRPSGRVAT
jgi:hypothetical protein